jgi:serine/threonine-protein kinase
MIGEQLGNYRVVSKLGSGGMGSVFLAEHRWIERRAAIKVLNEEMTRNPSLVDRFFNEARATSLIHSPGIVEVFDCNFDRTGLAYIVMEYLEGETLATRLGREHALPWPLAVEIARQVAVTVGAAHEKGIVHRDLKPDNIFLLTASPSGGSAPLVKVLDFGIAKLLSGEMAPRYQTMSGALFGTPGYMSPEQWRGADRVDHRTDVYALGCMLFEMIRGMAPFVTTNVRALMSAHMKQPAPALAAGDEGSCPTWLADLVARMLAKDPGERPPTMAAVAQTLERGAPSDGAGLGGTATDVLIGRMRPAAVRLLSATRRPVVLAAALGVLVAGGLLGATVLARRPQRPAWPPAGGHEVPIESASADARLAHTHPRPSPPPPAPIAPIPPIARVEPAPVPQVAPAIVRATIQRRPGERFTSRRALAAAPAPAPAKRPAIAEPRTTPPPPKPQVDMDGLTDL